MEILKSKKNILLIILLFIIISTAIYLLYELRNNKTSNTAVTTTENETDPFTNTSLVKDGKSDYMIVIPEDPSHDVLFASNELILFFKEATGITLTYKYDTDLVYDSNDKYLSIGDTTIYRNSNVDASYEELGLDGLKLVTEGNTVIMAGGSDSGAMYAMYEFLERTFKLEIYAGDEWYIDKNIENLYLKDFDVTEIPLFPRRSVGLFPYSISETFRNRMRQELYNEGWILWSHSHFKILPPEEYLTDHPDWYSEDQTQLCLTNDEMRQEFTRNVIELIKDNPDANYIMLGQEDTNTFCVTPENQAEIEKYKESGVMMRFINKVADDVQAYIDENEPERIFFIGTFGYQKTQQPPVKLNDKGEYIPIDDSVIPRDNVMVMIAPIYAINNYNYYDESNEETKQIFEGWKAVAHGHMFTWIYNKIFAQYFIPFDNFSTLVQNYQILSDLGVQFVYHQGNKETAAGGLQELMCYVEAKLMWNVNQNPDDLASEFIENYYKDAAPYFQEYYDLIRFNYSMWEELYNFKAYNSSSKSLEIYSTKYWTRDYLDKLNELFVKMLDSIKIYESSNPDLYEKLMLRIKKEKLTVDYLYLNLYFDEFDYDEAKAMIDDFEYVCSKWYITVWREMYYSTQTECLISSLVTNWRTALSQK